MIRAVLYLSVLLCLFMVWPCSSRTIDYRFDNWTVEDGLPQGTVNSIIEDDLGFIWVATLGGVARFDGQNFTQFLATNGHIVDNAITSLAIDEQGWIWIGTQRGLTRLHYLTYQSEHFYADENDPTSLGDNYIQHIHVDKRGKVWIATLKSLHAYNTDNGTFHSYSPANSSQKNQQFRYVNIASDNHNRVFVSTNLGEVYILEQQQLRLSTYGRPKGVSKLLIDQNDRLWVAGIGAIIWVYDLHSNEQQQITIMGNGDVRDMAIDNQGYVWVTTLADGVQIVSPQFEVRKIADDRNVHSKSLLMDAYRSVFLDNTGVLWLGSAEFGLFRQNKVATDIEQFINHQQQSSAAFAVFESFNGDIWLGINDRIDILSATDFSQLKASIKAKGYIFDIKQLDNDTWLAGTERGVVRIKRHDNDYIIEPVYHSNDIVVVRIVLVGQSIYLASSNGIFYVEDAKKWSEPVRKLQAAQPDKVEFNLDVFYYDAMLDEQGRLWFAGRYGGIIYVNTTTNMIEPQTLITNEKGLGTTITSIAQHDQQTLLLASFNGLYQYDMASKKITTVDAFSEQSQICAVVALEDSIWLNTSFGVVELDKSNLQFKRYLNQHSGIVSGDCVTLASLLTEKQCVVFGMTDGLSQFCPNRLAEQDNKTINKPLFTSLDINYAEQLPFNQYQQYSDKAIIAAESLILDHQVKQFALEFTTIDHSARQLAYAYKMDYLMDEWVEIKGNKIAFTTLPSGAYDLQVKVYDKYQPQRFSVSQLHITKIPAWWFSSWAFVIYGALILFSFVFFYRLKMVRNKRLTKRLQQLVHDKTAQLVDKNNEILEQKRALELAANKQAQLMVQKNTMLSAISHEMKTPLTVLKGALQHMEKKSKRKDLAFELMSNNCERLTAFVDQILLLSKFKTLQQEKVQQVPMSAIVRTVVSYLQPLANRYQQKIQVYIQDEISLHGNAAGIELAVNNLIKNAIVHAGDGCIIEVKVKFDQAKATVVVSDNGRGMDESFQAMMFDPFVSGVEESGSIHSGLGLSLCQQVVDAHKGYISVESQLGKGTRITLDFPNGQLVKEAQDYVSTLPSFMISAPVQSSKDSNYPLVLIADDEPDILVLLSLQLTDEYRLVLANGGQQAIELIKQHQPDIVIVDRYMPVVSGIEVLRQVRLLEQTKSIPVIMFSADTSDENQIESLREGIDMFIKKPFDYYLLKASIKRLIEKVSFANKENQIEQNLQDEHLTEQPTNAQMNVAREQDFLVQLSEVVQQRYQDAGFGVKCLAAQFAMSEVTFRNKVQNMTGVLPKHYLYNFRCEKAKLRLNLESDMSIADIAHSCGFKDEAQMRRWFKEFYGLTPSQLRKSG